MTDKNCISNRPANLGDPEHKFCRCMKSAFWARKLKREGREQEKEARTTGGFMADLLRGMSKEERAELLTQLNAA